MSELKDAVSKSVAECTKELEESTYDQVRAFLETHLFSLILSTCGIVVDMYGKYTIKEDSPFGKRVAELVDRLVQSIELPPVESFEIVVSKKQKKIIRDEVRDMVEQAVDEHLYNSVEEKVDEMITKEIRKQLGEAAGEDPSER